MPVAIWMHRGCVPFVSHEHFDTIYWPTAEGFRLEQVAHVGAELLALHPHLRRESVHDLGHRRCVAVVDGGQQGGGNAPPQPGPDDFDDDIPF